LNEDIILFGILKKRKSKNPVIGLHFTPDGIAVAQVICVPDQMPRLLMCGACEITPEQSPEEMKSLYKDIVKKVKSKNFVVNTTVQQQDRQLLLVEAPQVEPSELNEATKWKVKDMISFDIDEAVIDVIEIPDIKELKRSPMIYAVLIKRDKINEIIAMCERCDATLSVIDIPDLAQRNFAALLPEDQNGVAILSINETNSLLTITRKGELYLSRELETGFEQLMANVQNQDLHPESDTSELVVENSSIALLQSLERMVLEVQRSLDYYESQYNQPQISALFLAPFAYDIPEIKEYISTQLGIKTKILDFNLIFATDDPISRELQSDTFYAVGAALR
jgi:MSHA biogenesis protein MshI